MPILKIIMLQEMMRSFLKELQRHCMSSDADIFSKIEQMLDRYVVGEYIQVSETPKVSDRQYQ